MIPTVTTLATVTMGGLRPYTRLHIRRSADGDLSLSVHQSADGQATASLVQTYLTTAELRTLAAALTAVAEALEEET